MLIEVDLRVTDNNYTQAESATEVPWKLKLVSRFDVVRPAAIPVEIVFHGDIVVCRRDEVSLLGRASVGSTGPYGRLERLRASKQNSKVDISSPCWVEVIF